VAISTASGHAAAPLLRVHNEPIYLAPFVGREAELAEVGHLLAEPPARLVTLTGPGGIGKTRLALQAAARELPRVGGDAWFVELAGLSQPNLVPQAVVAAIGLRPGSDQSLLDALVAHLADRRLLLVLDNCEHLLTAAARLVISLLASCPNLRILATSREPLHIPGEVVWPVPPLSLPSPSHELPASLAELLQAEAVQLFVTRGSQLVPSFAATERNITAIAQVCRRLDGLPLAIELAAAWVMVLPVEQIAARLDDRFSLLVGGNQPAPSRQQTLRATLDWSHRLLSEPEQVFFRRLAVFAGGLDLEAAEEVCSGDGLELQTILGLLRQLAMKSLIAVERRDGERRYRLLESVQQYAALRLREAGEEDAVRGRHLHWLIAHAEGALPELWGAVDNTWLAWWEREQGNLRAGLQWALEHGSPVAAVRLAGAVAAFWYVRVQLDEGRYWLDRALAAGTGVAPAWRARAMLAAGSLAVLQRDYERASALLRATVALDSDSERKPLWRAWALHELGLIALFTAAYDRAASLFEDSLARFRELNDQAGEASLLMYRGLAAYYQADYEQAGALLEDAVPRLRMLGDNVAVARALHGLGMVARRQRHLFQSRAMFQAALETAWSKGDTLDAAHDLDGLAGLAAHEAEPRKAAGLFGLAARLRREAGTDVPASIRGDLDRDLSVVERQLGQELFASEYASGLAAEPEPEIARLLAETPAGLAPAQRSCGRVPRRGSPTPLQEAKRRYGGLTARERDVAILIARGKSNPEIAEALCIALRTAETHVTHILDKLGFSTRAQIAAWAAARGLLDPP
jgi:non-specific serine/threonine protein kinase